PCPISLRSTPSSPRNRCAWMPASSRKTSSGGCGSGPGSSRGCGEAMTPHAGSGPWSPAGRRRRLALLLLLPAALLLIFIFYLPVSIALLEGFRDASTGAWSLARFLALLSDPYLLGLLRFTARQAFVSAALSVAIGIPLGYLLANRSFPGKALVSSLLMVPFVMPAITVALGC